MDNPFESFNRWRDDEPPAWPEAVIKLIDAIREYLRTEAQVGQDLLDDGEITRAQYEAGMAENAPLAAWLKKMEGYRVNPSLNGLIKWKREDG